MGKRASSDEWVCILVFAVCFVFVRHVRLHPLRDKRVVKDTCKL
jgi:hypothetical protein